MSGVGIMSLRVPDAPWRETLDAAVLAEALGYSSLTVGESWGGDAFTTIAQFAAVTSRIGVGTSIVPVFARTPANIAMTALNLDRMSEGRSRLAWAPVARPWSKTFTENGSQSRSRGCANTSISSGRRRAVSAWTTRASSSIPSVLRFRFGLFGPAYRSTSPRSGQRVSG